MSTTERTTKDSGIRLNVTGAMREQLQAVADVQDVPLAHVCRQAFREFLAGKSFGAPGESAAGMRAAATQEEEPKP